MKFAKELDRDAVPEWRVKYLNYKAGKKHIKSVARAVNRVNSTPRGLIQRTPSFFQTQPSRVNPDLPISDQRYHDQNVPASQAPPPTLSVQTATANLAENEALTRNDDERQYGSFVASPPATSPLSLAELRSEFELPSPAIRGPAGSPLEQAPTNSSERRPPMKTAIIEDAAAAKSARIKNSRSWTKRSSTKHHGIDTPSPLRRIFSHSGGIPRGPSTGTVGPQGINLVREREAIFYEFMRAELDKVEKFYELKEKQAADRLNLLRQQLHEMRNRRVQEMIIETTGDGQRQNNGDSDSGGERGTTGWVLPIKAKIFPPGPNSKALRHMPQTPHLNSQHQDEEERRDYIRRPEQHDVSYRTAKRKLKLALQEFYRSLELLKSYALLNRTAFRKINKKFDKAVNARPPMRFVNDEVNKAWFVNSDVLDSQIKAVEDLYARYFERGNHKVAAGKLRSLSKKPTDESGSSFLNGFLIGTGIVFAIQGTIYGAQLLWDENPVIREQTGYLLQIYAGYFLMLVLFSIFCINCWIWTQCKINYPFIFEFDQRSHIDWRRLSEFPSFFLLLLGVFMWINFSKYGAMELYLYYPVVLIAITVLIILFPAPIMLYKTRRWFAYSHWRLLLAGIYPVEFRDFFLGDMYCSLVYAMANIELFFCLYGNGWNNPSQCNSNNSRALGFLTTLPAIWRLLQCVRRYKDTRNVFPHLVNGGKYTISIVSYIALSCYRIDNTKSNRAIFITFSIVNSIYTSIWDVFMDFSLFQVHSRHFFLRDILALKRRWPYYAIMVVDPILRFSWIFYAIFAHDTQHSTIVSFLVSLLEVLRRGIWALFRVENEHCANVSQYKASRDVPLPYRIEPLMHHTTSAETSPDLPPENQRVGQQQELRPQPQRPQGQSSSRWEGGFSTASSTVVASTIGTLRRRAESSSARTFSKILAEAHRQDFEKKRKPGEETKSEDTESVFHSDEDDDEDEDLVDGTTEDHGLLDIDEAAALGRSGTSRQEDV